MAKDKKTPAAATAEPKAAKCPISRKQFKEHAKPMMIQVGDSKLVANVKDFSTGSFGFYNNDKMVVMIDGVPCKAQVAVNITIVGSKELPKD